MYSRNDPRLRRTLNQISHNLESANESAQVGLFSVNEHYIKPCLSSVRACLDGCVSGAGCLPTQDERVRRARMRSSRSRAEASFDFYDDWEEDEHAALLSWADDEYEQGDDLAASAPAATSAGAQPRRRGLMDYGSRPDRMTPPARRRTLGERTDPTLIPSQSYFGFLRNLPFDLGRRALRYKPSAEGLRDRHKGKTTAEVESEAEHVLNNGDDGDEPDASAGRKTGHTRQRSGTVGSGHTTDSLSSRGDIFPSDDEDAVPLDDEFYLADTRSLGTPDDASSGHKSAKTSNSRRTSRTVSSQSTGRPKKIVADSPDGTKNKKKDRRSSANTSRSQSEQNVNDGGPKAANDTAEPHEVDTLLIKQSQVDLAQPAAPTTPMTMLALPNSNATAAAAAAAATAASQEQDSAADKT